MPTQVLVPSSRLGLNELSRVGASSNWACVDELVANDATDYVWGTESLGLGIPWTGTDSYGLTNLTGGPWSILSVMITYRGHGNGLGIVRQLQAGLYLLGASYWDPTPRTPPLNWTTYTYTWALNPATSQPFTASEVNAMGASLRVTCESIPGSLAVVEVTQVNVTVDLVASLVLTPSLMTRARTILVPSLSLTGGDIPWPSVEVHADLSAGGSVQSHLTASDEVHADLMANGSAQADLATHQVHASLAGQTTVELLKE